MRKTKPNPYAMRPMAVLLREAIERRERKEKRTITIREIAEEMGVAADQVSRYVRGETVPYKDTRYLLEKLAAGFRLPYSKVLRAARERPKKGVVYTDLGTYERIGPEPPPKRGKTQKEAASV